MTKQHWGTFPTSRSNVIISSFIIASWDQHVLAQTKFRSQCRLGSPDQPQLITSKALTPTTGRFKRFLALTSMIQRVEH
jgi:hypothetical protein